MLNVYIFQQRLLFAHRSNQRYNSGTLNSAMTLLIQVVHYFLFYYYICGYYDM